MHIMADWENMIRSPFPPRKGVRTCSIPVYTGVPLTRISHTEYICTRVPRYPDVFTVMPALSSQKYKKGSIFVGGSNNNKSVQFQICIWTYLKSDDIRISLLKCVETQRNSDLEVQIDRKSIYAIDSMHRNKRHTWAYGRMHTSPCMTNPVPSYLVCILCLIPESIDTFSPQPASLVNPECSRICKNP